jgi:MoxR-like ATPase
VVDPAELSALYDAVANVHIDESLERYTVDIVRATRTHPDVSVGASARGSLALYKTAQALAAARGRDYVIPDDIKEMAVLTLPHRLLVRPESQLRGRTAGVIVGEILASLAVPLEESGTAR